MPSGTCQLKCRCTRVPRTNSEPLTTKRLRSVFHDHTWKSLNTFGESRVLTYSTKGYKNGWGSLPAYTLICATVPMLLDDFIQGTYEIINFTDIRSSVPVCLIAVHVRLRANIGSDRVRQGYVPPLCVLAAFASLLRKVGCVLFWAHHYHITKMASLNTCNKRKLQYTF